MNVLLIGNYAADGQYSMLNFATVLHHGLCARGLDVRLLAPVSKFGGKSETGADKWAGYVDKYLLFPAELKRSLRWADLVHLCDQGNSIYVNYIREKPHLVTCHDMLAMRLALGDLSRGQVGLTGRLYQRLILNGFRKARRVVCVTETTREDVLRIAGMPNDRVSVIYNGLYCPVQRKTKEESARILAELAIPLEMPFLLHVGGNQSYKNRNGVLHIFQQVREQRREMPLPLRLVMAGAPFTEEMRSFLAENNLKEAVSEIVRPTNEQLQALYSRAAALLFPSWYEGFGLPIIEAQACCCPVFTSNRAPMTEVGGEAAVYIDPENPRDAASVIRDELPKLAHRVKAGQENVQRFSTDAMIEGYINTYQHVLKQR